MKKTGFVIVAGGKGERFGRRLPKGLVKINSREMFLYSLSVFSLTKKITGPVVLVIPQGYEKKFIDAISKSGLPEPYSIVHGGATRQDSVRAGLNALPDNTDIVLIHDSARPFVTPNQITKLVKLVEKYGAATTAIRISDSLRLGFIDSRDIFLKKSVDRENLWALGTPQGFYFKNIKNAHKKAHAKNKKVSDDTALISNRDKVSVLEADYLNSKITFQKDLELAELLVKVWYKRLRNEGFNIPKTF